MKPTRRMRKLRLGVKKHRKRSIEYKRNKRQVTAMEGLIKGVRKACEGTRTASESIQLMSLKLGEFAELYCNPANSITYAECGKAVTTLQK